MSLSTKKYSEYSKKELIEEIKLLKKRKKYGLVWEDKTEEVIEMCKKKLPVLKEVKNKWFEEMWSPKKDSYLIVGTQYPNPTFMVLGVFWPPK